jgi:hypothetical protein
MMRPERSWPAATFTNTAASGWPPMSIGANTTYVASYHTTGTHVATNNFLATAPSRRALPDQHLQRQYLLG